MVNGIWLTVNRKCNYRCLWCYAEGTKYDATSDMTWERAVRLITIGLGIGTKNLILLGGEPTLWPHLLKACRYIVDGDASATIVTNGWKYADMKLATEAKDAGVNVSISLKAGNSSQYKKLTKVDGFNKTLQAVNYETPP